MITFENDMEPVLVAFIYGKINYEQTIDTLTNRIIKNQKNAEKNMMMKMKINFI